jgi:hypothetical protein
MHEKEVARAYHKELWTAGFPRLSMFSVWIVMGASWALVSRMRCWRAR